MSEYESIHGTRVKYLTSDPTLDSSVEGQVWYNSTSGANKALVEIKAWAATGNVNTKRISAGGSGTATAGLTAGGRNGDASPQGDHQTEEYTGYTWRSDADMSNDRFETEMAGPTSAAVIVGGYDIALSPEKIANVEEFNGTSWSNGTAYPSAVFAGGAAGTETAAVYFGGYFPPPTNLQASTKEYDGSSWTASGNMNEGRGYMASCGSQTSALAVCGKVSPSVDVEEYDGSSWTTGGNYPTSNVNAAASGLSTAAIVFSGATAPGGTAMNLSAAYDGTAFITDASLATAREQASGSSQGTNQSAWVCLGNPVSSAATEEYSSNINAITQASWASGGSMGDKRAFAAGAGTQTAGIVFGGLWPSPAGGGGRIADTEEYDGSSWSEGGALNTGRTQTGGFGIQTAAVITSGVSPPGSLTNITEEYNGSSWTTVNTNPLSLRDGSCSGTLTAGLFFAGTASGSAPDMSVSTVEYDGTNWTSGGNLGTARYGMGSAGTQSDTLGFGGYVNGGGGLQSIVEAYNGTAWTSSPALATSQFNGASGGTSSSQAWFAGGLVGSTPNISGVTQQYDGTGWSGVTPLSTARRALVGGGTSPAAFGAGGYGPGGVNTLVNSTEEFTGETKTITASTLTTS